MLKPYATWKNMFNRALAMSIAIFITTTSISQAHDMKLKEECVGRLRFLLPEDAEVAAMLSEDFQIELDGGVPQPAYRFKDGQFADSSYIKYGGSLSITHDISVVQRGLFYRSATLTQQDVSRSIQESKTNSIAMNRFEKLSTGKQFGVAWRVDASYMAYLGVGNHSVLWRADGTPKDKREIIRDYQNILNGMSMRPMFSVPNRIGVCLPNIFIGDDGHTFRDISTTFRLRSHPDVLILIADSSATKTSLSTGRRTKKPVDELNDFWAQYENAYTARQVRSAWSFPSTRRMHLGDRDAVASFVRITRSNGSVDFGYLAVAVGDADADFDTPHRRIYAIREAKLAEQKGILPISEVELLAIVHQISKSIRPIVAGQQNLR